MNKIKINILPTYYFKFECNLDINVNILTNKDQDKIHVYAKLLKSIF